MTPRLDAYTATTRVADHGFLTQLLGRHMVEGDRSRVLQGFHGFEHRVAIKGEDGAEWAAVQFGGVRHGSLVMCEVKGERTHDVVEDLRSALPEHRCTRIDSASDYEQPGAFESFVTTAQEIKQEFGLRGERRGDWDYPEDGRTLYLGAPSSAVRVRLYEKGKQPDLRYLARPDLVRIECQVRPEKDRKSAYASATASDVWGASPWTRELAKRVLQLHVRELPPYTARRLNERDRALAFMCSQYGAHLLSLLGDVGDWACVGKTLGEIMAENEREKRKLRRLRQQGRGDDDGATADGVRVH